MNSFNPTYQEESLEEVDVNYQSEYDALLSA
jgi:hypothetical protein